MSLPGRLAAVAPGWDLIVDDARHDGPKTAATFALLWPLVSPGGYYVIEDWMVALGWPGWDTAACWTRWRGCCPCSPGTWDVEEVTYRYGLAVARKRGGKGARGAVPVRAHPGRPRPLPARQQLLRCARARPGAPRRFPRWLEE